MRRRFPIIYWLIATAKKKSWMLLIWGAMGWLNYKSYTILDCTLTCPLPKQPNSPTTTDATAFCIKTEKAPLQSTPLRTAWPVNLGYSPVGGGDFIETSPDPVHEHV